MKEICVLSYTLPQNGTYTCELKRFKRKGIKFLFYFLFVKLKYKTVEIINN
jgi:hypothetical protein